MAIGLGVMAGLVIVGLSVVAGAFVVHTFSAALLSSGQGQVQSGSALTTSDQQNLKLQSEVVERRRAAVTTYSAQFTEFKRATARPPGAVGINLGAAETRRRDAVLAGLVVECINAVDRYNLAAHALSPAQLRSAGLPERLVWAADCAPEQ